MKKHPLALAAIAFLYMANPTPAQVLLNFDDRAPGPLSTQYQAQGATFNSPTLRDYADTPGFAHSGTKAVELCFAAEFCKATLNVSFTTPEKHVKLWVGFTSPLAQASPVKLTALNAGGATVASQTVTLGPSNAGIPVQIPLEVTSATANIRQIVVGFAAPDAFNNGLVFDDLEFDTAGPPPVCPAPTNPTVSMTQPSPSTAVQINEFMLQGSVTTAAPLDQATLTASSPNGTKSSNLLGVIVQPTTAPFGATRVDELLSPGTNTITLSVRNCHGTSQATSTVTYTPVATGTHVKLIGMEITQATQDAANSVRLIAGKPTVVRLYFTTTGGAPINNVRGDITGFREGGNTPFLAQSINTTNIDASNALFPKRLDLTQSLNFMLSPDFYQQGLTHFRVERLNVQGPGGATLLCDGCIEWKQSFIAAKPLSLVVVPFLYQFSMKTADNGATLMGGLGYLNNVFPLAGNFPTDTAGINMTLLATRPTDLILPRDNDRMLFALEDILDTMLSQPGNTLPADTHILGVAPSGSGGVADMPGTAAFGDTRALESTTFPASDPESYGSIWAQELAHTYGRMHVSNSHGEMPPTDPAFPYAHGGIGEPGLAIGTESWNGTPFVLDPGTPASGSKHAHDFMSYGAPNDAADHTHSWVSPYTFQGLMGSFTPQAVATVPQATADKLVVSGSIDVSGAVTLRPFYITNTGFAKGAGTTGELSVALLDAAGNTLRNFRLDTRAVENSTTRLFSAFVPWDPATKQIVLKRDQATLATRAVTLNKPTLQITRPAPGETWGARATIAWKAADPDNDKLTYAVFYSPGPDQRWVPIATHVTATSATIDTALLVGSRTARVRVRATDGVNTTEADSAPFITPEHPPLVAILGVPKGKVVNRRSAEFTGAAYDPREGMLPAAQLKWTSDRDGPLGNGGRITPTKPLSTGAHVITLTATNSQGRAASKQVTITAR
jgi:hypothetical protein